MPIMSFYPTNSPFFVMILFMFEEKSMGNLITQMKSFNHHFDSFLVIMEVYFDPHCYFIVSHSSLHDWLP